MYESLRVSLVAENGNVIKRRTIFVRFFTIVEIDNVAAFAYVLYVVETFHYSPPSSFGLVKMFSSWSMLSRSLLAVRGYLIHNVSAKRAISSSDNRDSDKASSSIRVISISVSFQAIFEVGGAYPFSVWDFFAACG